MLRPYQREGVKFLAEAGRAILADEPGMGKTVQALLGGYLAQGARGGQTLIVAPGHAAGVWKDELRFWLDEDSETYAGTGRDPRVLDTFRYVITNYANLAETLRRPWSGVIFDEAHTLKNRKAETLFKTVKGRLVATDSLFFLTGSPVFKNAGDMWPLLYLIDRKRWPSYWKWVNKYAIVWSDNFGFHVEDVRNVKAMRAEIADVALARLKQDHLQDLPPTIRQRVPLTMTPKQAKAYADLEGQMYTEVDEHPELLLTAPTKLAATTRLRQLLVSPRILGIDDDGAAIKALREDAGDSPRPLLVFTPFAEAIPYIAETLKSARYASVNSLSGQMTDRAKDSALRSFQTSTDDARALVATIRMGTSWSGTNAAEVLFIGYDWDPPYNLQAEDRPSRFGQEADRILARYYVHEDTVDEDVMSVLSGKKRVADVIAGRRRR